MHTFSNELLPIYFLPLIRTKVQRSPPSPSVFSPAPPPLLFLSYIPLTYCHISQQLYSPSMDLSDLVHGLKPKSGSRQDSGRSRPPPSSSFHRSGDDHADSSRRGHQQSARGRLPETSGTSGRSGHDSSRGKEKSRSTMPGSSSSSASRDNSHSSSGSRLKCELCLRSFDSKTQFDQHTSVFHKRAKVPAKPREASFFCPHCDKAFTSPSKRNVHQNATHMGLRPHRCEVCSKSFGYKGGTCFFQCFLHTTTGQVFTQQITLTFQRINSFKFTRNVQI